MKNYFRVMLGDHSGEALNGGFIGADYGIAEDFSKLRPEDWRHFNSTIFIPKFLAVYPNKTKIAAGLAGGFVWHIAFGIKNGDIVLCQDDSGKFHAGEVNGDFYYKPGHVLPHRRPVRWFEQTFDRADMSDELKRSIASGAVVSLPSYRDEMERLIGNAAGPRLISTDETVEDPSAFAMEKHLEEFLVQNWTQTDLGKSYDIFELEGEQVGQQYPSDTGPIDILAISKDKKQLLVVELKKGRASDNVVGQILRYMGYVQEELAEEGQTVTGAIIALEDDQRIRRALAMVQNIHFYRYQVSFKLVKA
ncbi:MAG: endonuclease NucS domain-containing protein [Pirellulaceae bacterium]